MYSSKPRPDFLAGAIALASAEKEARTSMRASLASSPLEWLELCLDRIVDTTPSWEKRIAGIRKELARLEALPLASGT